MNLVFSLERFEGPLALLLCLAYKGEIDLKEIALKELTDTFLTEASPFEIASEFLGLVAELLYLKSRKLLPSQPELEEESDEIEGRRALLLNLLEYNEIKEAADDLSKHETLQRGLFRRAIPQVQITEKKAQDMEEVTLEELSTLLRQILQKAKNQHQVIIDTEKWTVAAMANHLLATIDSIAFETLFSFKKSHEELIATFLALLELLKEQKMKLIKKDQTIYIKNVI